MTVHTNSRLQRIRVLINPKSGLSKYSGPLQEVLERSWRHSDTDVTYQFSHSAEDGQAKTLRAVEDGIDMLVVVGGDGMVNSIGSALIGTDVALGVVPTGSGNGFARHFGIPLNPAAAARTLAQGKRMRIDVGTVNERPFFVTCSMAWDAALVQTFEKSPVRGVFPYVFAAVSEYFTYKPQPIEICLDGDRELSFDDPVILTVANLTQFGGGARIAPQACPDDGYLELVVVSRKDILRVVSQLNRLFDGTLDKIPEVISLRFRSLVARRQSASPLQLDGELVDAGTEVIIAVKPRALTVVVPV